MDIDQLETFIDVFRAGGFAAVARERGVSPSAVSRAISGLEASLQTRLFQRTTRNFAPTDAGEIFYHRVLPLIEELEDARGELAAQTKRPSGRLRVSASVSYGQMCIVPRLTEFRAAWPDINLELLLSDSRVDLLAERIDVAIRHGNLPDSSMIAKKLADVRYQLVASPDYLQRAQPISSPADISQHACLAFSYDEFRSTWQFRRAKELCEIGIKPVLTLSNAVALQQCALDGLGLALLADWTVRRDVAAGRLVELLPDWQAAGAHFDSSIWIVFPTRQFTPAKARVFADFLKA